MTPPEITSIIAAASAGVAAVVSAIGIIVVLVVLYVVKLVIGKLAPPELAEPVLFIVGAICLISLLALAANTMFGVGPSLGSLRSGPLLR